MPEIVPEEAETVKRIYRAFLQGKSTNAIAIMLTAEGIPTPGKKTVWKGLIVTSNYFVAEKGALQNALSKKQIGQLRKELADFPFCGRINLS